MKITFLKNAVYKDHDATAASDSIKVVCQLISELQAELLLTLKGNSSDVSHYCL